MSHFYRGVFLTGGAQGIGRCMTASLLEKGAKVLFCDIEADTGRATEEVFRKQYGTDNVGFVHCDVTDAAQLKKAFGAAVKKFGAVEVCANNAGIVEERRWEETLAINTTAQIRASELAFEHMRRDKGGQGGVIINTASIGGLIRGYWLPVTVASRHAVVGYTTSRASDPDVPGLGVRWCCFCPGPVKTRIEDFIKRGKTGVKNPEDFLNFWDTFQRLEPEDVARAFIQQLEDVDNNGKIMVVTQDRGAVYRQRILVDEDGVSNPLEVDKPLTQHPPVPGHTL